MSIDYQISQVPAPYRFTLPMSSSNTLLMTINPNVTPNANDVGPEQILFVEGFVSVVDLTNHGDQFFAAMFAFSQQGGGTLQQGTVNTIANTISSSIFPSTTYGPGMTIILNPGTQNPVGGVLEITKIKTLWI